MGHYSHLSIEEREDVMLLARQHKGVREIARTIGRDKSTVSRELARNSSATGAAPYYRTSTAQRKYERRRGRCHRQSLMSDPERRALVARADRGKDQRGAPGSGGERHDDLPRRLVGKARLRAAGPPQDEPHAAPSGQGQAPPGLAEAQRRQIQERLGIPVYFCAPHHPWGKGTNENTNGLLRDFFPKGRSLDGATDAEVNAAHAMLNRRPRKRLGRKCPQEVFCSQALHLL